MSEETNVFQNPSVAAFIGAGAAFLLVIVNDWRRRRYKKRVLKNLVEDQSDAARSKLESIRGMINMLENNVFCASPIMPFETAQLRVLQNEVLDLLDANHNQGLNALLYWMNTIDQLLSKVQYKSEILDELYRRNGPNDERLLLANWITDELRDADKNMGYLIKLFGYYVSGKPYKILEFQHEIPLPEQKNS